MSDIRPLKISSLNRKLLRDLLHMKGQALAISLVIACGIAAFVMSLTTLGALQKSQQTYYDRYRFADVFVHLKRAPLEIAERIREIPGVAQVEARIAAEVTLDVPGLAEPAVGRLISIPDYRQPSLNALHLRSGRLVEPARRGEVAASEAFAAAHGFVPGDSVRAVMNGRRERLNFVGIALSPEFVFEVQGSELFPDNKRFGVFWMGRTQMEAAFDMEGAFNDAVVSLMPGASEKEILRRIDDLVKPYGGLGSYGRDEQVSHRFLSDEIKALRGVAQIAPAIFLGVAAFLLNFVLSRLINTQREQIAALKAFGYTRAEVGWHYLKLAFAIVCTGVAIGIAAGVWLGQNLTELYSQFYRLPYYFYEITPSALLLALLVSLAAGALGVLNAVRRAAALPPAEAMRPEPPAAYHHSLLGTRRLARFFPASFRMIVRHLSRSPVKASLSIFGIALGVAVMIIGTYMEDSLEHIIDFQFFNAQRQHITLSFVEPSSYRALHEIESLPGVRRAEPFRGVPVRLRLGHRSRKLAIMGLAEDDGLYRVLDENGKVVPLPAAGLALSEKLGDLLQIRVGEEITVEVLEGARPTLRVPVTHFIEDFTGVSAFMRLDSLNRLMKEGRSISGAHLIADENRIDHLYATLKNTPKVASVTIKTAALKGFQDTLAENVRIMRTFNMIFAGIIAFGVVYNSARISLAERSRELATMRVMGFTRGEISFIFLGELALLILAAVPLGLCMGYLFALAISPAYDTELYRIPLVIKPPTYALAATVVLLAAVVSGLVVRHRLDHLDLTAVLKSGD